MYDLLQVMQQDGYLSSGELIALRKTCKELGENPVRILRSLNIASPEQIQEYLQRYFRVNALGDQAIGLLNESYQSYIPIDIAVHYSCFGLGEENSTLYVAMEDPSDVGTVQQLRFFLNRRIIPIAATVFQLAEGLAKIYRVSIPNLKLTTVIERSRGVIGGLRYEAPFESKALTIDSSYAGENLSDADSESVADFVNANAQVKNAAKINSDEEPSPEISFPEMNNTIYTPSPSVGFIDGSSGEIEKGVLDVEKEKAEVTAAPANTEAVGEQQPVTAQESNTAQIEAAPAEEGLSEDTAAVETSAEEGLSEDTAAVETSAEEGLSEDTAAVEASAEEGLSEDTADESKSTEQMDENHVSHLSALASAALVKVTMMQNQSEAIKYINSVLNSYKVTVNFNKNESYQIKGEEFSVTGDAHSELKLSDNSLYYAIDPVLKSILKMKIDP